MTGQLGSPLVNSWTLGIPWWLVGHQVSPLVVGWTSGNPLDGWTSGATTGGWLNNWNTLERDGQLEAPLVDGGTARITIGGCLDDRELGDDWIAQKTIGDVWTARITSGDEWTTGNSIGDGWTTRVSTGGR